MPRQVLSGGASRSPSCRFRSDRGERDLRRRRSGDRRDRLPRRSRFRRSRERDRELRRLRSRDRERERRRRRSRLRLRLFRSRLRLFSRLFSRLLLLAAGLRLLLRLGLLLGLLLLLLLLLREALLSRETDRGFLEARFPDASESLERAGLAPGLDILDLDFCN